MYTVDPVLQLDLAGRLEQVRIAEGRAQTEDVVPLRVLRNRLHDRAVHDDQVLRGGLNGATLPRVARVEQQGGTFQTDPVALPAALAGQLDLVLLAQEPFLDRKESGMRGTGVESKCWIPNQIVDGKPRWWFGPGS